jgi:hypothetical protein
MRELACLRCDQVPANGRAHADGEETVKLPCGINTDAFDSRDVDAARLRCEMPKKK